MRKEIDVGTDVICDFCGSDGDASSGGVMIGSNAVCGLCCESNGYYDPNYIYKDERICICLCLYCRCYKFL